jgi:nucleotide-binding universal stress UspA family protein
MVDAGQAGQVVRIDRILCAASASEHSPGTIAYASRLAAVTGAHLKVVHVSDPARPTPVALPASADHLPLARVSLEERVTSGVPSSEILRSAKERPTDLIVVGNHDRDPSALGFLGSTCGEVLRAAECGVLTVGAVSPAREADRSSAGPSALATVAVGNESEHGGPR